MSDMVVVMKDGVIQQQGRPEDIYNEPKNAFVADFIGESNIFDGLMLEDYQVRFSGEAFACVDKGFGENKPVDVVVRPEDVDLVEPGQAPLTGIVDSVVFKGVHYEMNVKCNGLYWLVHSTKCQPKGAEVGLSFDPDDIHIMKRLFDGDVNLVEGEVTGPDLITFMDVDFEKGDLDLAPGTKVRLTIRPEDIEVVSSDHADLVVYLESLVYKGDYNELVVYTHDRSLLIHSYLDQQVATDIGIKFHTENVTVEALPDKEGDGGEK